MTSRRSLLHPADAVATGPAFSTSIDSGTLYGSMTLDQAINWSVGLGRVTRREAISIPAIKGSRDRICALGSAALRLHGPDGDVEPWDFFAKPEVGVAPTATFTQLLDDLLFSERAWVAITHTGFHNLPAAGVRLDPESVSVQPRTVVHRFATGSGVAQVWDPDPSLIRIDSPRDGLLGHAGARAIRVLTMLERAALNAADGVPPMDYFQSDDERDSTPFVDDENGTAEEHAVAFLDAWATARAKRSTALVPDGLKYVTNAWNPEQLQLTAAREMALGEIARLTGVDPEDLGLSTTSRTYFNAQDRRRAFLDFTVGPYLRAIEDRFSMDDVTPPGYTARFDTAEWLRADDLTTAQTDVALVDAEIQTRDEIRERRGLAPLVAAAPTEEPANA